MGAGLHNLAKVVAKDSRISTFSISFARRMDLRPTAHSMPRSAEREPEPGSTLTQTIMGRQLFRCDKASLRYAITKI